MHLNRQLTGAWVVADPAYTISPLASLASMKKQQPNKVDSEAQSYSAGKIILDPHSAPT
jgi:hypothetical protein